MQESDDSDTLSSDEEDATDDNYINLTKIDHDDLINIIEKWTLETPHLATLLADQLQNAKCKDSRGRRWHHSVISLALGIWAE